MRLGASSNTLEERQRERQEQLAVLKGKLSSSGSIEQHRAALPAERRAISSEGVGRRQPFTRPRTAVGHSASAGKPPITASPPTKREFHQPPPSVTTHLTADEINGVWITENLFKQLDEILNNRKKKSSKSNSRLKAPSGILEAPNSTVIMIQLHPKASAMELNISHPSDDLAGRLSLSDRRYIDSTYHPPGPHYHMSLWLGSPPQTAKAPMGNVSCMLQSRTYYGPGVAEISTDFTSTASGLGKSAKKQGPKGVMGHSSPSSKHSHRRSRSDPNLNAMLNTKNRSASASSEPGSLFISQTMTFANGGHILHVAVRMTSRTANGQTCKAGTSLIFKRVSGRHLSALVALMQRCPGLDTDKNWCRREMVLCSQPRVHGKEKEKEVEVDLEGMFSLDGTSTSSSKDVGDIATDEMRNQSFTNRVLKSLVLGSVACGRTLFLMQSRSLFGVEPDTAAAESKGALQRRKLVVPLNDGKQEGPSHTASAEAAFFLCFDFHHDSSALLPTYRFFLSPRTLYILLFNVRDMISSVGTSFNCHRIQRLVKAIVSSPSYDESCVVSIVGTYGENAADVDVGKGKTSKAAAPTAEDMRRCSEILFDLIGKVKVHVIYVDLADRRSIATCWRELALHMHTSAPPNSISRKLMLLEKRMTELRRATHTPVMAWDQFKAECLWIGLRNDEIQNAAFCLNDAGVVLVHGLSRRKQSGQARNVDESNVYVFLSPEWVCNLISSVLVHSRVMQRGKLYHADLPQIWQAPQYPPALYSVLLGLLESCQILIVIRGTSQPSVGGGGGEASVPSRLHGKGSGSWMSSLPQAALTRSEYSLVPFFFPETPGESIYTQDESIRLFGRFYMFAMLPEDLVHDLVFRIATAVAGSGQFSVLDYHASGILIGDDESRAALLFDKRKDRIRVIGRGHDSSPFNIITDELDNTMMDYPSLILLALRIPSYRHLHKPDSWRVPDMVDLANIIQARAEGNSTIEVGEEALEIALLAPDVVLEGLPKHMYLSKGDITMSECIGRGAFGDVFLGTLRKQNHAGSSIRRSGPPLPGSRVSPSNQPLQVAIKVFQGQHEEPVQAAMKFADFRRELFLQAKLQHPYIVNVLGACLSPLCIVMEYVGGGDLRHMLSQRMDGEYLPSHQVVGIMSCIAAAIHYLHSLSPPIIHRDLKSPNILMVSDTEAKLCDFGVSTNAATAHTSRGAVTDNPLWLAPEVLQFSRYTFASDVYALGIVLSELLSNRLPFEEHDFEFNFELEDCIMNGMRPSCRSDAPRQLSELMYHLIEGVPEQRPSSAAVVQRLWQLSLLPPSLLDDRCSKKVDIPVKQSIRKQLKMSKPSLRRESSSGGRAEKYAQYGAMTDWLLQEGAMRSVTEEAIVEGMLKEIVASGVEGKALDVGCGPGLSTLRLAALTDHTRTPVVVGIDPAPSVIQVAETNCSSEARIKLGGKSLNSFAASCDETFIIITARVVLSFLQDIDDAIAALNELLTPGGTVVISLFHPMRTARLKSAFPGPTASSTPTLKASSSWSSSASSRKRSAATAPQLPHQLLGRSVSSSSAVGNSTSAAHGGRPLHSAPPRPPRARPTPPASPGNRDRATLTNQPPSGELGEPALPRSSSLSTPLYAMEGRRVSGFTPCSVVHHTTAAVLRALLASGLQLCDIQEPTVPLAVMRDHMGGDEDGDAEWEALSCPRYLILRATKPAET